MRIRIDVVALVLYLAMSRSANAQNWSFDAREIGLGGVGSGNLASGMIAEERDYLAIVLPFGLFQVLKDFSVFDPGDPKFDPIRVAEYAATPIHYVVGRDDNDSAQALFVNDIRNATLSRDLSKYKGFEPANSMLAEGLASPSFGHTIKIKTGSGGAFQGIYIGAGPYLSMHSAELIDPTLTGVLESGVNVANATMPMTSRSQGQLALAITGGYRGRMAWPPGIGSGTDREGLYVAADYNYLRGFEYQDIDMVVKIETDRNGLVTVLPTSSPIVIDQRHATKGTGYSIDLGIGAVIDHMEFGFGARGIGNRINWSDFEGKRYTLGNLLTGNSNFVETTIAAPGEVRIELPIDYRGDVALVNDEWTTAAQVGHGFGGNSFHGGVERRFDRIELRGGARYTIKRWNPTGGIGFNLSDRFGIDVAAYGTTANIEQKHHLAIAASLRFEHK